PASDVFEICLFVPVPEYTPGRPPCFLSLLSPMYSATLLYKTLCMFTGGQTAPRSATAQRPARRPYGSQAGRAACRAPGRPSGNPSTAAASAPSRTCAPTRSGAAEAPNEPLFQISLYLSRSLLSL